MDSFIFKAVVVLVPLVLCLTVHEYAHARVALALGDRTALDEGRMTLSPVSHIDPFGTLLLPLLMLSTSGAYFGWARPVPYNPARFDRRITMRTGAMLVAFAGPASNFLFALIATIAYAMLFRFGVAAQLGKPAHALLEALIAVNVTLGFFNLMPVPPLDGAKVLAGLLPDKHSRAFEELTSRGGVLLFMVLMLTAGPLLSTPIRWMLGFLTGVVLPGLAGA